MEQKRELGCYIVSGGVTTAVNYVLYAAFLALHLDYLVANGLAWCGAVVARLLDESQMGLSLGKCGRPGIFLVRRSPAADPSGRKRLPVGRDRLSAHPAHPGRLLVSVVTVVGNYVLCKYKIFASEGA